MTLANPFGPTNRGWQQASAAMDRASALYRDGEIIGFENLATYVTPDLAYIVETERFRTRIAGSDRVSSVALRTTSVFRPEDDTWKIVHRHADPITTVQTPQSVVQP